MRRSLPSSKEFSSRSPCGPSGALIFGTIADRYGRRPALMIDIVAFSVFELSSAFAPSLHIFLLTRALFGIAMGGEWGVGAALAFETLPKENRGFFSGVLQEGYVAGYLLAALVYGTLFHYIGWRGMFVIGALPAFLIIYIRTKVEESPAWQQGRGSAAAVPRNLGKDIVKYLGTFIFLTVLMFAFNVYSHGTQDVYPTFLQQNRGFSPETVGLVAIIYNLGALLGGVLFGSWSERIGRRKTIVIAALLTIPMIPLWVYPRTAPMLALGSFLMQLMVQGAWGVIPAHLNELSPQGSARHVSRPCLSTRQSARFAKFRNAGQARRTLLRRKLRAGPRMDGAPGSALVVIVTISGREAKGADLSDTS